MGLQLQVLNALKGINSNQTIDSGLVGKLAPSLLLALGSGAFKNSGLTDWIKKLFQGNTDIQSVDTDITSAGDLYGGGDSDVITDIGASGADDVIDFSDWDLY
jgi:hypothetical protein